MKKLVLLFVALLCSFSSAFASIESDVYAMICKAYNIETPSKTASFINDLGADSLATVELVAMTETHFGIEITDAEMSSVVTVDHFIKLVKTKVASKQ